MNVPSLQDEWNEEEARKRIVEAEQLVDIAKTKGHGMKNPPSFREWYDMLYSIRKDLFDDHGPGVVKVGRAESDARTIVEAAESRFKERPPKIVKRRLPKKDR